MFYVTMTSPIGSIFLFGDASAVTGLYLSDGPVVERQRAMAIESHAELKEARRQIDEYFAGERQAFDLPLRPTGTTFQKAVWSALLEIPFGSTCSYQHIANVVGNPKASRAVGMANGRNPISLIVPCHRVIGADGSLTGYGGGLPNKRWLLDFESRVAAPNRSLLLKVSS